MLHDKIHLAISIARNIVVSMSICQWHFNCHRFRYSICSNLERNFFFHIHSSGFCLFSVHSSGNHKNVCQCIVILSHSTEVMKLIWLLLLRMAMHLAVEKKDVYDESRRRNEWKVSINRSISLFSSFFSIFFFSTETWSMQ